MRDSRHVSTYKDAYERPQSDWDLFVRWCRKPSVGYAIAMLMALTGLFRLFAFNGSGFDYAYGAFFLVWASYTAWDARRRSVQTDGTRDR